MKFENKRKRIRPKYKGHRQLVKILKIQKGGEPKPMALPGATKSSHFG